MSSTASHVQSTKAHRFGMVVLTLLAALFLAGGLRFSERFYAAATYFLPRSAQGAAMAVGLGFEIFLSALLIIAIAASWWAVGQGKRMQSMMLLMGTELGLLVIYQSLGIFV